MCVRYRFIQYNPTSLERNYKYEVLTEHDLGVTIDLINRETYASDYSAQLDPADEKLLEEDVLTPQDSKRLNIWSSFSTSWKFKQKTDGLETGSEAWSSVVQVDDDINKLVLPLIAAMSITFAVIVSHAPILTSLLN